MKLATRPSLRNSVFERTVESLSLSIIRHHTLASNSRVVQIGSGQFAGVLFYRQAYWSSPHEIALKLLGLYEQQILEFLNQKRFHTFISLGASDGYYAVSLLKNIIVKKAFCVEKDARNFPLINDNLKLNNVPNQSVVIVDNIESALKFHQRDHTFGQPNLLICDIEGDEYELLLDSNLVSELSRYNYFLILELHDRQSHLRNHLKEVLKLYYELSILQSLKRDLTDVQLITNPYERFMFAAEVRGDNFEFLLCKPRQTH